MLSNSVGGFSFFFLRGRDFFSNGTALKCDNSSLEEIESQTTESIKHSPSDSDFQKLMSKMMLPEVFSTSEH